MYNKNKNKTSWKAKMNDALEVRSLKMKYQVFLNYSNLLNAKNSSGIFINEAFQRVSVQVAMVKMQFQIDD